MKIDEYFSKEKVRTLQELERDLTYEQIMNIIHAKTDDNIRILMKLKEDLTTDQKVSIILSIIDHNIKNLINDGEIFFRYYGKLKSRDPPGKVRTVYILSPKDPILGSNDPYGKTISINGLIRVSQVESLQEYYFSAAIIP